MSWYAFDAVDDALSSTRRFLFPFRLGRWLRLMVVVFFLGGGGGGFQGTTNVPQSMPTDPGTGPTPTPGPTLPELPDLMLLLAVLGVILLLILVLGTISATMRFVLVDMLRTDEVRIRRWFGTRFGKGFRLFVFQTVLGLLLVLPILVVVALFFFAEGALPAVGVLGIVAFVLVLIPYFFVGGLISSFTSQLVVPVMVASDVGVLAGWRRLWPTLRGHPWQFTVYVVVRWVLALGIGIATGIIGLILGGIVAAVGVGIGFVLVGAFGGFQALLASHLGIVALVALALLTILFLLAVFLPIAVVVQSFLTSYELSVLGRAEPRFALLPETGDGGGDEGNDGTDGDPSDGPHGGDGDVGR
ncbi:hypothetical protein ACFQE1_14855, partial [Halobium palmae]